MLDAAVTSGGNVDVFLITADADPRVMMAFSAAMNRYARQSQTKPVLRVVDGLHAYGEAASLPVQMASILEDGVALDWVRPTCPLSQLNAVIHGLRISKGQTTLAMNPDMYENLEDVKRFLLEQEAGKKLVFARRMERKGVSMLRRWLTHAFSAVARVVLDVPLRDVNSAMILVSRSALECLQTVPPGCPAPYLFVCHALRHSVAEVPINVREFPGKKSAYNWLLRLKTSLVHFREMALFRIWLSREVRQRETRQV
jgi:hypothetical protein